MVGLLAAMKLANCKRDPNAPVEGYRCKTWNGECTCTESDSDKGTCGRFECCYKWALDGHSHYETMCMCTHGDPETHACAKAMESTQRVESCP